MAALVAAHRLMVLLQPQEVLVTRHLLHLLKVIMVERVTVDALVAVAAVLVLLAEMVLAIQAPVLAAQVRHPLLLELQ
jgi:hypothetical protein